MAYTLGNRSRARLVGVHPSLKRVVARAIELTEVDFTVLEGVRSEKRQRELYEAKKSKTLNSRHLTGHAVDLGALVGGKVSWEMDDYVSISKAMKAAAEELDVKIVWGGDWKSFKDGPHFELQRKAYPAKRR